MSLKEKLSKISQNLQETKAEKEKKAQEEELKPIRLRIKELENQKFQLDLVKGSLELKSGKLESGEKIGKGMREYSKETKEQDKKESTRLDTLMDENKEALQSMGVENKDQLIENPEFAEEPEVVSYKKAKGEVADLEMSDSALKEKLKTLGVNIDEENFSYDSAEKALAEKLQLLEGELLQEKLKTPEGKKEAIEVLSKDLEKSIPQIPFSKDEKSGAQTFNFFNLKYGDYEGKITIQGEKTKFEGWKRTKLLPEEITVLEKTYGKDVVKGALLKAYENRTDIAFEDFDKRTKNIDKDIKADLERTSPEKNAERESVKKEMLQVVETAIDAKMKAKELLEEIETQNFGGGIYDVENEVSRIEENKKDALVLMGELTKLESELPEKLVILDGNEIIVPSVKEQLDQLRKNRETEEQKLKNKKQEIYKQESNGPKLFGKNKWEKNLANLKKEKEVLEKEINKMQNQDYDALYKKYAFRIPTKQYSEVENLVKGQKNIQGSPSEVLGVLKAQLNEIINQKVPSSVINLYKEYKDLEKKLD